MSGADDARHAQYQRHVARRGVIKPLCTGCGVAVEVGSYDLCLDCQRQLYLIRL